MNNRNLKFEVEIYNEDIDAIVDKFEREFYSNKNIGSLLMDIVGMEVDHDWESCSISKHKDHFTLMVDFSDSGSGFSLGPVKITVKVFEYVEIDYKNCEI